MKTLTILLCAALVACGGTSDDPLAPCAFVPSHELVRSWSGSGQKILLIGDSIIERWTPSFPVMNQGVGGQCSTQIHARFKRDAIDHTPDVIVLDGGINDVFRGQLSAVYMQQAALDAKAAGIKIVIVGPYGRPGTPQGIAVNNWNADMLEFVKTHGFAYIDNTQETQLQADGTHLTDAGYATLEARVQKELK